jgi:hypothetical protein
MPVYEVIGPDLKPRLIKAKNINGARAHAAADIKISRPSGERAHVLAGRGVKLEFAEGCEAQADIEEPGDAE